MEEKIKKLKNKISKLKEKNKITIEDKSFIKIESSARIEENKDENSPENVTKDNKIESDVAAVENQPQTEKEKLDEKESVNNCVIVNDVHS